MFGLLSRLRFTWWRLCNCSTISSIFTSRPILYQIWKQQMYQMFIGILLESIRYLSTSWPIVQNSSSSYRRLYLMLSRIRSKRKNLCHSSSSPNPILFNYRCYRNMCLMYWWLLCQRWKLCSRFNSLWWKI